MDHLITSLEDNTYSPHSHLFHHLHIVQAWCINGDDNNVSVRGDLQSAHGLAGIHGQKQQDSLDTHTRSPAIAWQNRHSLLHSSNIIREIFHYQGYQQRQQRHRSQRRFRSVTCSTPYRPTHLRSRSQTNPPSITISTSYASMMPFHLATVVPGSPPELSSSKSSKSSSFHSSSLSPVDVIPTDLSHFEDIGLHDERPVSGVSSGNGRAADWKESLRRKGSSVVESAGRSQVATTLGMRTLLLGGRNSLPKLAGQVKHASKHSPHQSLSLPITRPSIPYREHGSLSSPTLVVRAIRKSSRSRSLSPAHPGHGSMSSQAEPGPSSSLHPSSISDMQRSKANRKSWQSSGRKTAAELEAECDELDEDLPDDASLWNVPLSPGLYREASSAASSANVSTSTSPERPTRFSQSLGNTFVSPLSPRVGVGTSFHRGTGSVPNSPISSNILRGHSTGHLSDHFTFQPARVKSWNTALTDLSEEAKALSAALDAHSTQEDLRMGKMDLVTSLPTWKTGSSTRTQSLSPGVQTPVTSDPPKRSKTAPVTVELPPLRKSEIMVDPLPISKEKERVLSRTRPSWLPPKDKHEEKRHVKEYRRIMELSAEAERKRELSFAHDEHARSATTATLRRLWQDHVLQDWNTSIKDTRTRELWWRGIDAESRPEVWKRAIGNDLAIKASTYDRALAKAAEMENELQERSGANQTGEQRREPIWFSAIERDVAITFPRMELFQKGQSLHSILVDVLRAYATYRRDVGYAHGTHLIAALILYIYSSAKEGSYNTALPVSPPPISPTSASMDVPSEIGAESTLAQTTFLLLANLLNRSLPTAFLTADRADTSKTYRQIADLLMAKYPRLYAHLFDSPRSPEDAASPRPGGLGLAMTDVFEPMIRTLFLRGATPGIPLNVISFSPIATSPSQSPLPVNGPAIDDTLEVPLRIWDVLLFDGDAAIVRACVALLGVGESRLYGSRTEVLEVLGWSDLAGMSPASEPLKRRDTRVVALMGCGGVGDVEAFMKGFRSAGRNGKA